MKVCGELPGELRRGLRHTLAQIRTGALVVALVGVVVLVYVVIVEVVALVHKFCVCLYYLSV